MFWKEEEVKFLHEKIRKTGRDDKHAVRGGKLCVHKHKTEEARVKCNNRARRKMRRIIQDD